MSRIRVVTYNIRKGKGASGQLDGSVDRLGRAVAALAPDLVLAQEVFHIHGGASQSAELGRAVGLRPYYEPNRTRRGGHVGNATLTHLPVQTMANHDVSTNRLERRGVLYLRLEHAGRPLHVFNAHLGLNQRQRSLQVRQIGELIGQLCGAHDPLVLAGDFNDWNRRLDRYVVGPLGLVNALAHLRGAEALTWHARRPMFCLDRIYLRHLRVHAARRLAGAPWNVVSDHFPLWAELEVT